VVASGLPFPQEKDFATVRDLIRALLGPRPQVNTILGSAENGVPHDIEVQMNALIAYRAKIVALIGKLEGEVPGSEPITVLARRNLSGIRKPITAVRAARKRPAA